MRERKAVAPEHQAWLAAYLARKDWPAVEALSTHQWKQLRAAYRQMKVKLSRVDGNTSGLDSLLDPDTLATLDELVQFSSRYSDRKQALTEAVRFLASHNRCDLKGSKAEMFKTHKNKELWDSLPDDGLIVRPVTKGAEAGGYFSHIFREIFPDSKKATYSISGHDIREATVEARLIKRTAKQYRTVIKYYKRNPGTRDWVVEYSLKQFSCCCPVGIDLNTLLPLSNEFHLRSFGVRPSSSCYLYESAEAFNRVERFQQTHKWERIYHGKTAGGRIGKVGVKYTDIWSENTVDPCEDLMLFGFEETDSPTTSELKAAYRKLAAKYHPDRKGGSAEKMAELNAARDRLLRHW